MAAAAAAAAVHPSPPLPARRGVARLACTHLVLPAQRGSSVDTVFCLFLASMWILFWGLATMDIGRLACGEGCVVVSAAYKVVSVAARVAVVFVIPLMVILLALMIARTKAKAAATDIEATKVQEPVPKTSDAAVRDVLCGTVTLWLLGLTMVFALLMLIGVLLKGDSPVMGSRRERMGSMIYDVGSLGMNAVDCFFLCPAMTVWIWRARRMARLAL